MNRIWFYSTVPEFIRAPSVQPMRSTQKEHVLGRSLLVQGNAIWEPLAKTLKGSGNANHEGGAPRLECSSSYLRWLGTCTRCIKQPCDLGSLQNQPQQPQHRPFFSSSPLFSKALSILTYPICWLTNLDQD